MILFSIVITLYNKGQYIQAALDSVLRQRYSNFEIIVIDDGSVDDGADRVAAARDSRIRLIRQENAGVSCARNRGIAEARGDIVCFLDADDWYSPAYLEIVLAMTAAYPDIVFFATNFKRCYSSQADVLDSGPAERQRFEVVKNFYSLWRRRGPFFCTNSVAVRRSALNALEPCFPPGEFLAEDQDLWFRLSERHALVYCAAQLVAYRMDVQDSLCTFISHFQNGMLLPAFARLDQRIRNRELPQQHLLAATLLIAEKRINLARLDLLGKRRSDALQKLFGTPWAFLLRRWWITLGLCALSPVHVRRWELRRRAGLADPKS